MFIDNRLDTLSTASLQYLRTLDFLASVLYMRSDPSPPFDVASIYILMTGQGDGNHFHGRSRSRARLLARLDRCESRAARSRDPLYLVSWTNISGYLLIRRSASGLGDDVSLCLLSDGVSGQSWLYHHFEMNTRALSSAVLACFA